MKTNNYHPIHHNVVTIPLTRGYHALVDREDLPLLSGFKWSAKVKRSGKVYAHANIVRTDGRRTTVMMHRLIIQPPTGVDIDHWDGDGLHNWRTNLRRCSKAQNSQNSKVHRNRVTAQYKGVWRVKGRENYRAGIKLEGKRIHLGTFPDELSAAYAYDEAARRLFGEFARCNFPEPATELKQAA